MCIIIQTHSYVWFVPSLDFLVQTSDPSSARGLCGLLIAQTSATCSAFSTSGDCLPGREGSCVSFLLCICVKCYGVWRRRTKEARLHGSQKQNAYSIYLHGVYNFHVTQKGFLAKYSPNHRSFHPQRFPAMK